MRTAPPFHPDLRRTARRLPRQLFNRVTYPLVRAGFALLARFVPGKGERVRLENGQRALIYHPASPVAAPCPALLWIPGGGLVMGAPEFEAALAREIADTLGIIVVTPSYRLAPAAPYPAALEDVDAALHWLAGLESVDPSRIAIGGDSAGGGLAACLCLHATTRDGPRACFQLLHQPMLDEATRRRPDPDPSGLRMWSADTNRFGWSAYLAGIEGDVPATASAARAPDDMLADLPPTWIGCGTADLFHAEAETYAKRLRNAGVESHFHPIPGAFHSFTAFAANAPVSRAYIDEMIHALAEGLRV
jgi:acetyl esterase/lipase